MLALLWQRLDAETRFTVRWWLVRALADFGEAAREGAMKRARSKTAPVARRCMRVLGWLPANRESQLVLRKGWPMRKAKFVRPLWKPWDASAMSPPWRPFWPPERGFHHCPDELVDALLACGDAGRAVLRQAVAGSEPAIRALLLQRLGADGHPDALPLLLEGLRDASPLVRQSARQGLARQSDERAVQALAALPDEP
ncbi:HEAT repeat domain-containing protein [Chloracidobacterium aggregatum]|uniref:HEAT repeat domain-containing protein n=1 Tax=Chloracidobacterium aggregatum TaxID=2851959 RepID=UPI001B8CAE1B|nr:HEAT repeat domain-containing protein [Chloracidobacterium aggregatum]QUV90851.1 HEAT repeat domain-containing protein [Chloracidobacterium sp. A]